ncbi:MAG: FxsA family protein [Methylococcaceae bacterium]
MAPFQLLLLFFLVVPIVEIYLLLKLGAFVGVFPTVLLVVSTAIIGSWMLRQQGFATFQRLQASMAKGQIPTLEIIEGPILLVGGALLLTPGFFTDVMGFICLIPVTRKKLVNYLLQKQWVVAGQPNERSYRKDPNVIEGEFKKDE